MTDYTATPGQPARGMTLSAGDTLRVLSGGMASGDLVGPGAIETVSGMAANETASGTVLTNGQQLTASFTVAAGGVASGTQVRDGASLVVFGTASGTLISGAAPLLVNGQTYLSPTSAVVMAGGIAVGTTIGSGASVAVDGLLQGATVQAGGVLYAFGSATAVTVLAGGSLTVALGHISGTVVSGGTETVQGTQVTTGALATGTQVFAGGLVRVTDQGEDTGTIIHAGGREFVSAGGTALSPVIAGGTLELGTSGGANGACTDASFAGPGGTLLIDGTAAPPGSIAGFGAGDDIVFAGLPASMHPSLGVSGDTVTLTADGVTDTLTILGAGALNLQLGTDAATGGEAIGVACYCAGTAILTDYGEVPVETIAAGDRVVTADGRVEPVVWVGRRSYAGRFLAGRLCLLPVRFTAGSLGNGLPRRDLLVSPCHAMFLDGVLVQAGHLTNGCTIVRERMMGQVDYVHIELARHDVILAEGAASETYLEDANRMMFANAGSYPGGAAGHGRYCAPRPAGGYGVERIRKHLAGLAGTLGRAA